MKISRRRFLQTSGAAVAAGGLGVTLDIHQAEAAPTKIAGATKTTTICPYCSVGCSILVYTKDGKVVHTEGDPDSPINQGSLCSKGMSIFQLTHNNPARLTKPLYRAPKSTKWEEKSWDWTLKRIAQNIKKSRDESFKLTNAKGETVNRTEGIASVGSAAMDNEECFIYQKFLRGLGLAYIEHQARI
jgi:formate dehydrogenase major subunit